ncbi:MAG TPA: serine hydroxymethyltransferase, partial [Ignavibacteriales bacterium]|nr:serine hydroxymethyltransferase [Ignavibacteriales bacterium]
DSMVMPGIQGGPLMHIIMAKAVAFGEALQPSFKGYAEQVIKNSKQLASKMTAMQYNIVSGGTDNHLMLIDLTNKGITGKEAENTLGEAGITVNKNMVPYDKRSPFVTSGIRIGTPAMTTRGMKEKEMDKIAELINRALTNKDNKAELDAVKKDVVKLCSEFPLYPELR